MTDENEGISNKTIAILVILALVISIIGTWAVLSESVAQKKTNNLGGNVGIITLNIMPQSDKITGKITLEVK